MPAYFRTKGFTLIELLVVIAIIGILAVAFLPSLLGAPAKGRDAQRMATVQKIENFIVSETLIDYSLPGTNCIAAGCYWNGMGPTDGWCSNSFDQCFMNASLSMDETACNANSYCNWTNASYGGFDDGFGGGDSRP